MRDGAVYLASVYQSRDVLRGWRDTVFTPAGIEVTSNWLEEPHGLETQPRDLTEAECREYALLDLGDVDAAQHLVSFSCADDTPPFVNNGRGGRHVELGYALALGRIVWLVGRPENMLQYAVPKERWCDNVYEAADMIRVWNYAAAMERARLLDPGPEVRRMTAPREVVALDPGGIAGTGEERKHM